jgi:hypothetical protein
MNKHEKVATHGGEKVGFAPRPGNATTYGFIEGYPAQITAGNDGQVDFYLLILRYDDESHDADAKAALEGDPTLRERKVKGMEIGGGMVVYKRKKSAFGSLKAEQAAGDLMAIAQVLKEVCPAGTQCGLAGETCAGGEIQELTLLDNVVSRACEPCLAGMHENAAALQALYDAIPTRWGHALPAAFVLTIVGAGIWGGVLIASNSMLWIVAIGIGALVGWGVSKAAVKGSLAVQVLGALSTVVAVVSGNLVFYGSLYSAAMLKEGVSPDWGAFVVEIPNLLIKGGEDTVFAVGGGLVGAFYSAKFGARTDFSVSTER